jgi:hypothetical protein
MAVLRFTGVVGGTDGDEGRDQDDPEDDGSDQYQLLRHGGFLAE